MSTLDAVVVATDHDSVAEVCRGIGAPVEMTRTDHPSGTDRIAEVAERPAYADYDVVVNIQGDEPLLREEHLAAAVRLVRNGWDVGTCAAPIDHPDGRKEPSVVKVVRSESGRALYFSRAAVPYKRDGKPSTEELRAAPFLRHIGIYAYRRDALLRWVALPPSQLERLEMLEQLRPLEAGMPIGVAVVGAADAGVDTPADAVRTERRLRELGHEPVTHEHGVP
jgi:3-deoxy-manno-octulosonate cytidylyltransferase (CMP-KDO synthetase)